MQRRRIDRFGTKLTFDKLLAVVHQFGIFVAADQHILLNRTVLREENAENNISGEMDDAGAAGGTGRSDRRAREGAVNEGNRRHEDEPENRAAND